MWGVDGLSGRWMTLMSYNYIGVLSLGNNRGGGVCYFITCLHSSLQNVVIMKE